MKFRLNEITEVDPVPSVCGYLVSGKGETRGRQGSGFSQTGGAGTGLPEGGLGDESGAGKVATAVPFGSFAIRSEGYQTDFHHRFPSSRAGVVCQGVGEGEGSVTNGVVGVDLSCRIRERPIDSGRLSEGINLEKREESGQVFGDDSKVRKIQKWLDELEKKEQE
jgi:hypothetical protein